MQIPNLKNSVLIIYCKEYLLLLKDEILYMERLNLFYCIYIIAHLITLKCLSIRTPETINFPFVPNGKLMVLGVPIFEHIIIRLKCTQILGHIKIMNFPFGTNGKFIFRCSKT